MNFYISLTFITNPPDLLQRINSPLVHPYLCWSFAHPKKAKIIFKQSDVINPLSDTLESSSSPKRHILQWNQPLCQIYFNGFPSNHPFQISDSHSGSPQKGTAHPQAPGVIRTLTKYVRKVSKLTLFLVVLLCQCSSF